MNNFLKRFFTTSATKQRVLDTQQSQREKWGEHQKSQSGSQWFLGRYLGADNHRITNTDSKIFLEELGFTIHSDNLEIERDGVKIFVGHGDGKGPKDYKYKFLKKIFRNQFFIWIFNH